MEKKKKVILFALISIVYISSLVVAIRRGYLDSLEYQEDEPAYIAFSKGVTRGSLSALLIPTRIFRGIRDGGLTYNDYMQMQKRNVTTKKIETKMGTPFFPTKNVLPLKKLRQLKSVEPILQLKTLKPIKRLPLEPVKPLPFKTKPFTLNKSLIC